MCDQTPIRGQVEVDQGFDGGLRIEKTVHAVII